LGIFLNQLKELTKTKEFDEAYNLLFAEQGHDPRYRAAQAAFSDLLPAAFKELEEIITSADTPKGVKLNAIKFIVEETGVNAKAGSAFERELYKYLPSRHLLKK
jgi:hypothetical protein